MEYGFIGIDPGKTGGIALIDQQQNIKNLFTMPLLYDRPNTTEIAAFLSSASQKYNLFVVIEKQTGFAMQGGVSTTLINYGILIGILELHLLIKREVMPTEWSKEMCPPEFSKYAKRERKIKNAHLAQKLFPKWKPKNAGEIKTCSDALLLALYARKLVAGLLTKPNSDKPVMLNQSKTPKQIIKDYFKIDDL